MSHAGFVKGLASAGLVVAAALEPIANSEPDLVRYAITQGGLLAVVLVVLFFYRRDFVRFQQKDEERIAVLTSMAERMGAAVEHSAAATLANKEATDRLARALEGRP